MRRRRLGAASTVPEEADTEHTSALDEIELDNDDSLARRPLFDVIVEQAMVEEMSPGQIDIHEKIKSQSSNSPIFRKALSLIKADGEPQLSRTLKSKELGLSVGLVGAAEMQVHRLALINQTIFGVEQRLAFLATHGHMGQEDLMEFYKVLVTNAEKAGKFIAETGKSVNWEAMKKELLEIETLQSAEDIDEKEIEIDAIKMLRHLTSLEHAREDDQNTFSDIEQN